MKTDKDLVGILIQDTNSEGLITQCQSAGSFLTTASKFAPGCLMTDSTTGVLYRNSGTTAAPVWGAIENSIVKSYVPTADGTGTGAITPGTQIATVTSANANHWVTLPAPVVGTLITLVSTNTTGYEIRTSAPATVGINGGVGANAESAIAGAAGTMVQLLCVSATNWIAWSRVANGTLSVVQVAAD
jgi:hypothetical protein